MGNMSYCRFENTFNDLMDCYNELCENGLYELSKSEKKYAIKLIETCKDLGEDFEEHIEADTDED